MRISISLCPIQYREEDSPVGRRGACSPRSYFLAGKRKKMQGKTSEGQMHSLNNAAMLFILPSIWVKRAYHQIHYLWKQFGPVFEPEQVVVKVPGLLNTCTILLTEHTWLSRTHSRTWMTWLTICSPASPSMLTKSWRKGMRSTSASWMSRS